MKEFGLEVVKNATGDVIGYKYKNIDKLIDVLEEDVRNKTNNQYTLDNVAYLRTILTDRLESNNPFVDEVINGNKVENLISAILNSRMKDLKRFGGSKPQVTSLGREKTLSGIFNPKVKMVSQ